MEYRPRSAGGDPPSRPWQEHPTAPPPADQRGRTARAAAPPAGTRRTPPSRTAPKDAQFQGPSGIAASRGTKDVAPKRGQVPAKRGAPARGRGAASGLNARTTTAPPRRPGAPTRTPPPRRGTPRRTPPRRNPAELFGKVALGLVSVLVLTLTGYAWASMQGLVSGLTVTDVIGGDAGGPLPADGSRDILLVGMDSRTDAQGNPLDKKLINELRVGKDGGQLNTDTLILVHIPNDGSKAVAISIPRDSYVDIPGYGQHKINSAYGRGKVVERRRLQEEEGVKDPKELELRSNQEGAKVLIATIEQLTGKTIDNYASINLLGFYQITKAIGGVDVCLKNPVSDIKSHADFPAGEQTISGTDALAFVRQRHGLPRGDLDRVVRQQVFMAGLANKVLSAGTLANPGKLNALLDAITKSVVLNQGWDVFGFAQQLGGLSGGQIQFKTIPVLDLNLRTPADGSAVEVDPDEVRAFVVGLSKNSKPGGAPPPTRDPANEQVTVDVMNTTGTQGLAASVSEAVSAWGFKPGTVGNSSPRDSTVVRHAPGDEESARKVADALAGNAQLEADPAAQPGRITVFLGADYPTDDSASGGGSQPQAHPAQVAPPSESPLNEDKKITADRVTCVN